ncbi:hypothetical protein EYF80_026444 [Liparis tanakae]|uniref:Uncharacterized protein n=1 Tax=Liparis tanakae TaxID=230148 RepID=A0A4Z2HEY7_9TELE|nr:hypothetical protein EYF80_026444 [Liparis tanakae]
MWEAMMRNIRVKPIRKLTTLTFETLRRFVSDNRLKSNDVLVGVFPESLLKGKLWRLYPGSSFFGSSKPCDEPTVLNRLTTKPQTHAALYCTGWLYSNVG